MDDFHQTLWHATAGDPPDTVPLSGEARADVAIVGGGFTGLSAALHLRDAGADVAVLEAAEIGWGASGRNAGFVVPNFAKGDPRSVEARLGAEAGGRLVDLVGGSADALFALIARYDIDCEAEQTGWIQPAHAPEAVRLLEDRCAQWAARGRPAEVLDKDAVARLTGCGKFHGGWLDRSGGQLQPLKYAHGLATAALRLGARLYTGSPVKSLARDGGQWRVRAAMGSLVADQVLLCTNAYGGPLWPRLRRSLIPLTVHQLATAPLSEGLRRRILPGRQSVSDTRDHLFTFRLAGDGRLISGGMAAIPFGAHRRMARYIAQRLDRMLDLGGAPKVAFIWSGVAAMTRDFLPRLHELAPGLFAGIGCNGRGIAMTTVLGQVLADAALQGHARGLPVPVSAVAPLPVYSVIKHAPRVIAPLARWRDAHS